MNRFGLSAAIDKVDQLNGATRNPAGSSWTNSRRDRIARTGVDRSGGLPRDLLPEAIGVFREMLAGIDTQDLATSARRTPSLTDDQIVARIRGVDERLDNLVFSTRQRHDELRDMQHCVEALGRLIQQFRASKFDAARSTFLSSVDVLGMLDHAKNEHDIEEVWDRLRKAQRWGPSFGEQLEHVAAAPDDAGLNQCDGSSRRGRHERPRGTEPVLADFGINIPPSRGMITEVGEWDDASDDPDRPRCTASAGRLVPQAVRVIVLAHLFEQQRFHFDPSLLVFGIIGQVDLTRCRIGSDLCLQ